MNPPDYYQILQVSTEAEPEVIDAAYKRLAFKYHADRNPAPDAHARMTLLNEAYETLSRPDARAAYDRARPAAPGPPPPAPAAHPNSAAPAPWPTFPWRTFWRYPFAGHPLAPWAVLGLFVVLMPAVLRWALGSVGTGWFAPLGGTIAAALLLALNHSRLAPLAYFDRPHTTVGPDETWTGLKVLGFLVLVGAFGFGLMWYGIDWLGQGATVVGRWVARCQVQWGVWAGAVPVLVWWRAHRRSRRQCASNPVPERLYAVALAACLAGGVIGPSSPYEWRLSGLRATAGDPDAALAAFGRALERYPAYAEVYIDRAGVWRARGETARALADVESALALDPKDPDALLMKAALAADQGQWVTAAAAAEAAAERLEAKNPSASGDRQRLGVVRAARARYLFAAGDLGGAISEADKAIRMWPECADAHLTKGKAHLTRGETDSALESFERTVTLAPKEGLGYWWRSKAFGKKGDLGRSIADGATAAQLDPSLSSRTTPTAPPTAPAHGLGSPARPTLSTSVRGSLIGRGQVLILQNTGPASAKVQAQVGALGRVDLGTIEAGGSKEVGWLELGAELRTGDVVTLWVDGQLQQTVRVP